MAEACVVPKGDSSYHEPTDLPLKSKVSNVTIMILICVYSREFCPSVTEDKGILDDIEGQAFDVGTCNGGHFNVFE